jgi:hypothetical protein
MKMSKIGKDIKMIILIQIVIVNRIKINKKSFNNHKLRNLIQMKFKYLIHKMMMINFKCLLKNGYN